MSLSLTWTDIEPFANHLWQSTLVLAVCAGLAALLRHNRAHVRHWLWLLASLKFAVPFAWLAQLGELLPSRAAMSASFTVPPVAGVMVQPFSQVFTPPAEAGPLQAAATISASLLPTIAVVIWAAGVLTIGAIWLVRWRRLCAMAAAAEPVSEGREAARLRALEARARRTRPLRLRMTDDSLEPGVFGVLRPVLLWPRGISARLDEGQVEAVLAHELSHVQRHDNLKAALHMAVQAVFWFHPLVWWLGARLMDERERACDEAVLQWGSDPETYAEGILKTCEFSVESPLACVSGVTGADLRRRIEQIMEHRTAGLLSLRSKVLLTSVAGLVLLVPVLAGSAHRIGRDQRASTSPASPRAGTTSRRVAPDTSGPMLHQYSLADALRRVAADLHAGYRVDRLLGASRANAAQATAPGAAAAPPDPATAAFDVASVKPNKSGDARIQIGTQLTRFTAENVPLRQLIVFAYGIQPYQVEGGPSWVNSERFDITAKIPEQFANRGGRLGEMGPINYMLQKLLADRFKLVLERSTKEAQIYELRLARGDRKLGPALTRSSIDCGALMAQARAGGPPPTPRADGAPPCGLMMGPGSFAGGGAPLSQLARALASRLGRPVIDKTGLTGEYDFTVSFAPEFPGAGAPGGVPGGTPPTPLPGAPPLPAIDPNAPNIFTAVQEQLGLKLEGARGPVETVVIKNAEMPMQD